MISKKDIIVLFIQMIVFYIIPIISLNINPFGMVISILLFTLILSLIIGIISDSVIKYFYPIMIAIIFIPSVYIFYNSSALIHAIWYLVVSYIGLIIGILIKHFILSNQ